MKQFISFILTSINFLLIAGSCALAFYGYFFYSQETREQLNTLIELFTLPAYVGSISGLIGGVIYFFHERR